ncbi:RpiR family transcriptional regulator [Scopulibacillus darangshiensis]|uniref:RpiR family transcriptional regulator n=1 Tax=Scopulibacillus darangshiensis TaxID=442528 RepID=A0A4R2P2S9_9BACL|nr:MurR/RpiR family transcriptional regulator [Scopulibacillus darangshiensis]TCP29000.1 RpiR family transcriptional regulator [Scopulibacillus darangshiensis]
MNHNVYHSIAEKLPTMSKSHKKIAKFILENTNTVPFFTVAKMAKKAEVSEATVVRFAVQLGYSGYPELQQHMQNSVQQQLTTVERLQMSSQVYEGKEQGIYDIFQDDIENIKTTMGKLDISAFNNAVNAILNAKKVYISANRSAASLGVFLQYYLNIVLENTELIRSVEELPEQLYKLDSRDVVFGISFARYSSSTVKTMAFAKKQGAKTIVLTDNLLSPLVPNSDIVLTAASQVPTFIDSFAAPLSLINALVTHVGKERINDVDCHLEKMEEIWEQLGIFYQKGHEESNES